jgi:hypothetical protein
MERKMPGAAFNALMPFLEIPARPFARCLARLWNKGWVTTKLMTGLLCMTALGPVGVVHALADTDVHGGSEWRYVALVIVPMVLIAVGSEVLVHNLAKRLGSSAKPSAADWLLFWGAPVLSPIIFIICTV